MDMHFIGLSRHDSDVDLPAKRLPLATELFNGRLGRDDLPGLRLGGHAVGGGDSSTENIAVLDNDRHRNGCRYESKPGICCRSENLCW